MPLPPFTAAYGHARRELDGQQWLRVGTSSAASDGWLAAEQTSDWKQSLVLKFTERSGRAPVMFLRDAATLERLLSDPQLASSELAKARAGKDDEHSVLA